MRQVHRAGDKCFVDYAGQRPRLIDPITGEVGEAELFAAVLGASNYTYAEATRTQQVPDWIASHARAFAYFGGVTAAVVCDQLKSGVIVPCRYEPALQRTYEEFAEHYGTAILPARPAKPRDKAKIEAGVLVAERWILARLRHETFFSLATLNARIAELLTELNARPMRVYRASRRELFERLDQPALRPLPAEPFIYGEWKVARVNVDYHVEIQRHYYSVPYALLHEVMDTRVSATTVEIFHRGQRIAAHLRDDTPGRHTTIAAHMPKAHQHHLEWTPSRLIHWAEKGGPATGVAWWPGSFAESPTPRAGVSGVPGADALGPTLRRPAARGRLRTRRELLRSYSYRTVEEQSWGLGTGPPALREGRAVPDTTPRPRARQHPRRRDYYAAGGGERMLIEQIPGEAERHEAVRAWPRRWGEQPLGSGRAHG